MSSVMMASFTKESYKYCHKFIYIGQTILEYNLCNIVIHTKCFKKSDFKSKISSLNSCFLM